MRRIPEGVTCCQRISSFVLSVHTALARAEAGVTVCAWTTEWSAAAPKSERSARETDATMRKPLSVGAVTGEDLARAKQMPCQVLPNTLGPR
jgi:hypothetical protein